MTELAALQEEVAALEEAESIEDQIARLEARRATLLRQAKTAASTAAVAALRPDLPKDAAPTEARDILDEALIRLAQMPTGPESFRLHELLRDGKKDDARAFMREAAIKGGFARDIDSLVEFPLHKLPENSQSILTKIEATKRGLLDKMIREANSIAGTGLEAVG